MEHRTCHLDALESSRIHGRRPGFSNIVATHSGYFVSRQFLAFTAAHWANRPNAFWSKLHTKKHGPTECFPKNGRSITCSRAVSTAQIDREKFATVGNTNRIHSTAHRNARLRSLPPAWKYLQTEPEKVSYFCNQLKVPNHFLPRRLSRPENFPADRSLLRR